MAIEVKIPAVGESISSGVVSVWHKKSGEFVNAGDALFTLETDKVSTEITAEKAETKTAPATKEKSTTTEALSPAVRRIVEEEHIEPDKISGTGKDGRLTK